MGKHTALLDTSTPQSGEREDNVTISGREGKDDERRDKGGSRVRLFNWYSSGVMYGACSGLRCVPAVLQRRLMLLCHDAPEDELEPRSERLSESLAAMAWLEQAWQR